jgi:hypothetical protein
MTFRQGGAWAHFMGWDRKSAISAMIDGLPKELRDKARSGQHPAVETALAKERWRAALGQPIASRSASSSSESRDG